MEYTIPIIEIPSFIQLSSASIFLYISPPLQLPTAGPTLNPYPRRTHPRSFRPPSILATRRHPRLRRTPHAPTTPPSCRQDLHFAAPTRGGAKAAAAGHAGTAATDAQVPVPHILATPVLARHGARPEPRGSPRGASALP
jgi:hypothetical protein